MQGSQGAQSGRRAGQVTSFSPGRACGSCLRPLVCLVGKEALRRSVRARACRLPPRPLAPRRQTHFRLCFYSRAPDGQDPSPSLGWGRAVGSGVWAARPSSWNWVDNSPCAGGKGDNSPRCGQVRVLRGQARALPGLAGPRPEPSLRWASCAGARVPAPRAGRGCPASALPVPSLDPPVGPAAAQVPPVPTCPSAQAPNTCSSLGVR